MRKYSYPIIVYILWRTVTFLFQLVLQPFIYTSNTSDTIYERIILSWTTLTDAEWYTYIATNGYAFPLQTFFPLNPILVKLFSFVLGDIPLAAFAVSTLSSLCVFVLLYKLAERITDTHNAKRALLFFAVFPGTMFLLANYSEGPTLLFTLLSFYLFEQKYYLWSALTGAIAGSGRLVSSAISTIFLFAQTKISLRLLYFGITLLGLLGYMSYLAITFQNPFMFVQAQREWCSDQYPCILSFPLWTPIKFLLFGANLSTNYLDVISTFIFLGMLWPVYKRLGPQYALYSLLVLITWLTNGKIVSMTRYCLMAFPVFILMPEVLKKLDTKIYYTLLISLFLIQLIYSALFTGNVWIG